MTLTLVPDSITRSVSEGILGENKQPQPLANASGYKLSAIGRQPNDTHFGSGLNNPKRQRGNSR